VLRDADAEQLRKNRKAASFFEAQPPWYRRSAIHWVVSAKREETRQRDATVQLRRVQAMS
jgi:uncharacterized protein YdeI (YjbR/CyaY-like superfamily)